MGLLVFLFGTVIGSFCGLVISRLPQIMESEWQEELRAVTEQQGWQVTAPANHVPAPALSLSRPRSRCDHCGVTLRPWQMIPILSALWLRGRCAHCGQPMGWLTWGSEWLIGGWAWLCWHTFDLTATGLMAFAAGCFLWVGGAVDARSQWLPDRVTYPLLWLGLFAALFECHPFQLTTEQALLGVMGGWFLLWSVATVFHWWRGVSGLGGGDVKLLAGLGAWLGPMALPAVILVAALLGIAQGLWLRWRHQQSGAFAFGPALCVGAIAWAVFQFTLA